MSKPKFETTLDDLDQRIYTIIYRETAEDISSAQSYLAARIRRVRTLLQTLLNKGEVLDDDLIRCAIHETAQRSNRRYNPAEHGGRSYGQQARIRQSGREENAQEDDWTPCWMRNY